MRPYEEDDHPACRSLWVELTEHHRRIYRDPTIGGDDPGAAVDEYLSTPERVGSWVAGVDGTVVGLTGVFDDGEKGVIEPVVVTAELRRGSVGHALIQQVVDDASARGHVYLTIRPVARNTAAVHAFHAAGFRTHGGHVDLTMDLTERRRTWQPGASLHGLDFEY